MTLTEDELKERFEKHVVAEMARYDEVTPYSTAEHRKQYERAYRHFIGERYGIKPTLDIPYGAAVCVHGAKPSECQSCAVDSELR